MAGSRTQRYFFQFGRLGSGHPQTATGSARPVQKINLLGLDMGLWVEPEAISPDSDLYRAHPDWAFGIPGREPLEIRQQYTLDFSRPEVVAGIWQQLDAVLQSCPLKYLKWDMNRSLAQVYSAVLPAKRQGEVYHRYVLGCTNCSAV